MPLSLRNLLVGSWPAAPEDRCKEALEGLRPVEFPHATRKELLAHIEDLLLRVSCVSFELWPFYA